MAKANGKLDDARFDKRVAQFLAIRAKLKELEVEYERICKPFEHAKQQLAEQLLTMLDAAGIESARTSEGTVYVSLHPTASLSDPDAFMDYVAQHGAYELMDRKANSTACREFAEETGALPPGVRLTSRRTIGVKTS
jgi:hypothetical protein